MSKHGADYCENCSEKHTNLMNEIDMHEPRTDWQGTLVSIVMMVAAGFLIYGVVSLVEALSLPTY